MVWFHDIGVHVNSALIFISIFTEPAHSLFDITFQYTTFLERTCLACLISILNGSVFWFHGIGIHVNLALLLSALRWAHKIGLRIKSEKLYRSGEVELFSFFEGLSFVSWYFDWFSILISLNWRARPARSLNFGITLSTEQGCQYSLEKIPLSGEVELFYFSRTCLLAPDISIGSVFLFFHGIGVHVKPALLLSALRWARNRVVHQVWKNSPYRGRLNYFHFFEDLSVGCWHLDRFSILISRNWRARQARSYTFGITLSTDQGCASFWKKFPLQREVELFSFLRGPVYWFRPFRLVQSFDFTELACTSRLLFYFRHYVEHGTRLPIKSEKFLAFWLDVLWLLARQTPWGLLGWFLDVTSSTCWTSYILVSFNKRLFQSQINNLSRCIFWDFGVMLFIHVH